SGGICRLQRKIDAAIARSKLLSVFGKSAGAKFSVIRLRGRTRELVAKAALTRSLASSTVLLAEPTMTIAGKLLDRWHSISTRTPWLPISRTLLTPPSMGRILLSVVSMSNDLYLKFP